MDKIQMHKKLCDQLNEIYQKKNSDYGDSFGKSFRKRGITAVMVRMEDKWNRLDNLTLHPENIMVNDESIGDTLLDLANYCLMTYMELNSDLCDLCTTNSNYKNMEEITAVNQSTISYITTPHNNSEYE